jgi:hypothetical protein
MDSDYYEWPTSRGPVTIERNEESPGLWDLYLNGAPLQEGYNDPDEAAFDANKADFGNANKIYLLKGIYVPSDLSQWRTTPTNNRKKIIQNN